MEEAETQETQNRYEREFTCGKGAAKYRFKVVVQDAQIYLQCIDKFEDIFELSKDLVKGMELTEILDPYLFDHHKDITNALFDVYIDLGEQYVK